MRYLLLIYGNEQAKAAMPAEDLQKSMDQAQAYMMEANRSGVFLAADPLQPTGTATTIRKQDGKVLITDGPFAETKEQLGGYIMLDCRDLDEALEWAAKFPGACGGVGCVEVRPIHEVPGFGKKPEMDVAQKVHG
jgi:hypothetical protein